MHNHKIKLYTFTGSGATQAAAVEDATRKLEAWYREQPLLFFADGGSVFQFGTAALIDAHGLFTYIITAFHTPYSGVVYEPSYN